MSQLLNVKKSKISACGIKFFSFYLIIAAVYCRRFKPTAMLKVGVRRLELPASSSRTTHATNCATPRIKYRSLGEGV